jgi:hypothetical protein
VVSGLWLVKGDGSIYVNGDSTTGRMPVGLMGRMPMLLYDNGSGT